MKHLIFGLFLLAFGVTTIYVFIKDLKDDIKIRKNGIVYEGMIVGTSTNHSEVALSWIYPLIKIKENRLKLKYVRSVTAWLRRWYFDDFDFFEKRGH